MNVRAGIAIVAAALVGAPVALADDAAPARVGKAEVLSVPGHVSRWAFVQRAAIARAKPTPTGRVVARLRLKTEDGTDELTMVLRRVVDSSGRRWVQVRLPIRPNGSTGWVPQEALGGFHKVHTWLRIDTEHFRAKLVRDGRVVFRTRVGVGQKKWPTPHGDFYVRDRLEGFKATGMYG